MTLLEKYANLAVSTGINIQKGQTLLINVKAEHYEFARLCVDKAYELGAGKVVIKFSDDHIAKSHVVNQDIEELKNVPEWVVAEYDQYIEEGFARLSISSPSPGLMQDVDANKLGAQMKANQEALKKLRSYSMANRGQWSIVAMPTHEWASVVFPKEDKETAYTKLLEAILFATRVTEENDPVAEWEKHNEVLTKQNNILNDRNFNSLHFKNSLGTDIVVGLVKDHVWAGGNEVSGKGYQFNPNMPTEETFTMPDRNRVDGKVYSTKPLNYNGKLIDEFWLEFKDGKVIDFDAKKEKETLQVLLDSDEGSRRIGEIALISDDSPISNLDILFYNTLFDENASCHMALGASYPMNIKDGTNLDEETLLSKGANQSLNHVDFMFGSSDMHIEGITYDDEHITVFDKGNFVI